MRAKGAALATILVFGCGVTACAWLADGAEEPVGGDREQQEAAGREPPVQSSTDVLEGSPIPTWDSPLEGEPGEAAEFRGVLHGNDECLWVVSDRNVVAVQWPRGYRARFDPPTLLGPDGEVVAREGDEIVGSGGRHPIDIGQCQLGEAVVFRVNDVQRVGG